MTTTRTRSGADLLHGVDGKAVRALLEADNAQPHELLGPHRLGDGGRWVVRAFHPDAVRTELLLEKDEAIAMTKLADGLFAASVDGDRLPSYRLAFHFADGNRWVRGDPYRFAPTLGELDLHLIAEGTHRRLWEVLGAHPCVIDGAAGTRFAVWAPNARRASVVGDFCGWDGRLLPMRAIGSAGVFEIFVPGVGAGARYKYELATREGAIRIKTDPLAGAMDVPPGTDSVVADSSYVWSDAAWMSTRPGRDLVREPMSIYEVHLGSWARVVEEGNRSLGYREIAPRLVEYVSRLGFTHVELLPIAEHAYYPSWGYQVTGYYAPTARYGSADDLRFLVDTCHRAGIGVILDWVPAHFPKDDFSLRRFDGTALYEHEDPRRGEHPDWGTLIFNYGRNEVRNFLIANALYWLQEFHFDGLRVDAVASMLYLDYSRSEGQWIPNPYGGRENIEAIEFLRETNRVVREEVPGAVTVAEESTSWGGVTRPPEEGGLGFHFKWNMGWMHDTLTYFQRDPIHRRFHQDDLTFSMLYEHSEHFVNPLSHDEVVHGKGSLLAKMPGDRWQKFANLRALLAYQVLRPGKTLLFMGTELAPDREWNADASLDWHLADDPDRRALAEYLRALLWLYRERSALWRRDPDPEGFAWIDCMDRDRSIFSFERRDGEDHVVVVMNLTPTPHENYRIGAPAPGIYREALSSDAVRFGGSGFSTHEFATTEPISFHGRAQSLSLRLPPLGVILLTPDRA
jgi:1,4-alpha-glucan branching enzyme